MLFHISSHHTPDNCGVHRNPDAADGSPTPTVTDWGARCQEIGVTYIKGGINAPQHNHFMFVETDDMDPIENFDATSYGILGHRNNTCSGSKITIHPP